MKHGTTKNKLLNSLRVGANFGFLSLFCAYTYFVSVFVVDAYSEYVFAFFLIIFVISLLIGSVGLYYINTIICDMRD